VGGPPRGDDRGTHAGRGSDAGELHDPRHLGTHGVAVSRQALDEGRAARRRCPTAASAAATTAADVHAFVDAVGFPIVLKPRTGAGALDTARIDDHAQLQQALDRFRSQVESIAVEEFVEGHEGFYDTVSVDGHAPSTSSRTTTRTFSRRCGRGGSPRSSSPRAGWTPRRCYWANAYVRMQHPDYDVLRSMLDDVGRTVHVYAG
jgi:hypothetical protein